jgi:spore maturation protein CgeB
MISDPMRVVICGLSITSSWGNGHATTYRALVRELARRGHHITFLERNVLWYEENRDLPRPPYCDVKLYSGVDELRSLHAGLVRTADAVIVGSYVPEGVKVIEWVLDTARGVKAFYDIDTPVTVADLKSGMCKYLTREAIPALDLYLSFTGGPILRELERDFGAPVAKLLACSVDPCLYFPDEKRNLLWDLGYLGTYSDDRQPKLERLLINPAKRLPAARFAVAGPLYPEDILWPTNVARITHLAPARHRQFYNSQRYTLNVTRADMVAAGHSPSVRLFEAGACGTPIISDYWEGLDSFFKPGSEILLAQDAEECCHILADIREEERRAIGEQARKRVIAEHTSVHRAIQLEHDLISVRRTKQPRNLVFEVSSGLRA